MKNGNGYSKLNNILINKYKPLSDEIQGINFYIKNIKNKRIWTSNYNSIIGKPDKYEIVFTEDSNKIKRIDGAIETTTNVTVSQEEAVEIRSLELKNNGLEEETLEITSYLEPILSTEKQDYAHPAFNKLFLNVESIELFENNVENKNNKSYDNNANNGKILLVKRRKRNKDEKDVYLAITLNAENNTISDMEYEIDKEKFMGRDNFDIPNMVQNSIPFSKNTDLSLDPIIALKRTIKVEPGKSNNLNLIISANEDRDVAINNLKKYLPHENIKKCFELTKARVETEARYLGLKAKDITNYQKMLGYVLGINSFKKLYLNNLPKQNYPQSELWKYGISGDLPIILLEISSINDSYVLKDLLKCYEFYRAKNIKLDLVILDEEENKYERYVKEEIINTILNKNLSYMQNLSGGIYIIDDIKCKELLEYKADLILDSSKGTIERQIKDLEDEYLESIKEIGNEPEVKLIEDEEKNSIPIDIENLKYYNEYGGFSKDGKEYTIKVNKDNKLPTVWSHVIANRNFGSLITESMGGFTWSNNSRLNRITAWSNNQVLDVPSEIIYMQEKETMRTWSLGLNPMPDNNDYVITYGFGYAKYRHVSQNIEQELKVFIPQEESMKINILNLKNQESKSKKIKLVYCIKPVFGEDELTSNRNIELKFNKNSNVIIAKNRNSDNNNFVYISSSEEIKSYTGSKEFFIGSGNLSNPDGLKKVELNNENSLGLEPIIAIEMSVELEAFENKEIAFILGEEKTEVEVLDKAYQYSNIQKSKTELENTKKYWEELLERVKVNTPVESFNILLNGWMAYQSLVCRLWARSGFYQSGGAFGFRDQLQDTLGLKFYDVNLMKKQIIKHASHQFLEGDVEHWWHDETGKGIRTKFTDDLLWLAYTTIEYILFTNDYSILNEIIPYKKGDNLGYNIDERYDMYEESDIKESLYMHCIRAIERSINNFGKHRTS